MQNQEYVEYLKRVKDFFESHPTLDSPYCTEGDGTLKYYTIHGKSGVEGMKMFCKEIGGHITKYTDEVVYKLTAHIDGLTFVFVELKSNVCTRISDGIVKEMQKVPIEFEEKEVEVEKFHWECPDSILNGNHE